MKKESELNAVEAFALFGFVCAAGAVTTGFVLKTLSTSKVINYVYQTTREEIKNFRK